MPIIVPINEMRDTSKMFELSEDQPVFITTNGHGSRVLMNIDHYHKMKATCWTWSSNKDIRGPNPTEGTWMRRNSSIDY